MGNQMSQKEVKRAQVLDLLKEGKISQKEAAQRMGLTPAKCGGWPSDIRLTGWSH